MNGSILVLGRNGQVARELAKIGPPPGFEMAFVGRERFDLAAGADPAPLIEAFAPTLVINAAAYTAVDKAESEPEAAFRLNRDAPGELARACALGETPFVHFSTDYVFDGSKPSPYLEDDPIQPLGVYGASKAAGETAVREAAGRSAILRTSWVYSSFGANFVKTMLRLAESRDELGVVADQIGRPTWAEDCARGALHVALALLEDEVPRGQVFHLAGEGDATWADFAEAIFDLSAKRGGRRPRVNRISTADFPTPARRPANSRLDCAKITAALGSPMRPWRESLASCFEELDLKSPA
jgi:dTDP-4-dehydrorhamnose reductase